MFKNSYSLTLVDVYIIDDLNAVYTVSLKPGYLVDVKFCSESGLTYVMQNYDGSTVYGSGEKEVTFPCFEYNDEAVIGFVKRECLRDELIRPALEDKIRLAANAVKLQGAVDCEQFKEYTSEL